MDEKYTSNENNTNNDSASSDSLYSYSYRDKEQSETTHQGDYYEERNQQEAARQNLEQESDFTIKDAKLEETDNCAAKEQETSSADADICAKEQPPHLDMSYKTENFEQSNSKADALKNPSDGGEHSKKKKTKAKIVKSSGFWKSKKFGPVVAKCAVLAVVFGLVSGGVFQGVNYITSSGRTQQDSISGDSSNATKDSIGKTPVSTATTVKDVSNIVQNVMPSIVSITSMSQSEYYNMFGQSQQYNSESLGSGIIVDEDDDNLYIATNNHVVSGATSLTICFSDNNTASGTIKGTDPSSDLAVVQVPKKGLKSETLSAIKVAALGNSDELQVGESAVAIGNALGYGQSVTTGVISALNREVTTTDSQTGESITNELVQTDAAINPGNSGGALLNMNGEVIGINSVKYTDTQVEGMGYAIPINTAQPIIEELITREKVDESKGSHLGISGVDVTSDVAQNYRMPEGVYVAQITSGSAAETAGIKVGDIITEFDGHKIDSMETLKSQMQYYEAGTKVKIKVKRADNGSYVEKEINVTLGSKNS
ncbi:Periplasmic pH-dependent serine endoprotease DegQ precursor [uncultured Roseburia sp.]|uniref:Trypsin-like peptidase domain-containing protein n=1 Tax=Brotonthovivens ammoniilytica TaxID=2981725 RepID=A0ABT2TNP0_9FIRM|nr:trypsin-like peptidase domain-containing protein [Brotonthovivens ammoniilytica]MCU6763232.1 trypsin-like peptidase domain-containing protein [Brotonthovivens ammoniilytica]SCJ07776.1 Periplasmic pH-dependent serine endoprotease DegQ precursor [uncultured Roseburia sp.]